MSKIAKTLKQDFATMTTPITARQLLQEWLDTNSLEGQYVSLATATELVEQRRELIDDLIQANHAIEQLKIKDKQVLTVLWKWQKLADTIRFHLPDTYTELLDGVIADTQAILPNSTLQQSTLDHPDK